jgi:hypothetical protein
MSLGNQFSAHILVCPPIPILLINPIWIISLPSQVGRHTHTTHVDSGGLDASDSLPSMDIGHVVSLSDEIAEIGVLAPNSETLFAKKLSDLLVSLETASPGYGMEIACVLAGKASEYMIKKVEKSLRSKKRRRGSSPGSFRDHLINDPHRVGGFV